MLFAANSFDILFHRSNPTRFQLNSKRFGGLIFTDHFAITDLPYKDPFAYWANRP